MKELQATLNDAIITRIKAPFLGSFILCYMSVNIKGIVNFYLGTTEERKAILSNFGLWNLDLLWALILVLVYIGLTQFALPIFQIFINEKKFKKVTERHQRQSAADKKAHYMAMVQANEAKYMSNEEYIKAKFDRELGHWEDDKEALTSKVKLQDDQLETQTAQLLSQSNMVTEHLEKIRELADELSEESKKREYYQTKYEASLNNNEQSYNIDGRVRRVNGNPT